MLKVGKYETICGFETYVSFVGHDGSGSGYIVEREGEKIGAAWFCDGKSKSMNGFFDLDLSPSTITIPETILPMPMRERPGMGEINYYLSNYIDVGWAARRNCWTNTTAEKSVLYSGLFFSLGEAAQVWADFLNKYMAGKVKSV